MTKIFTMWFIHFIYLWTLCVTCSIHLHAQNCSSCDSLITFADFSDEYYETIDSCLFDLNYYNSERPRQLYEKAIEMAFEKGDTLWAARLYIPLSDLLYELQEYDSSAVYIEKAAQLFTDFGDDIGFARTANLRRLVATKENCFLEALNISYEAAEIFAREGDQVGLAIANRDIGSVLIQEKKYKEALAYCLKGVEPLERTNNNYELGFAYQRIAIILRNLSEYDKAQEYIGKAISRVRKLNEFRANQALSKKIWTRGYIYEAQGDYDMALLHYDSAKYYAEIIDFSLIDKWISNSKGSIYLKKRDYKNALEQFNKSLLVDSKDRATINVYDYYLPAYENLVKSHVGLKNYEKAFELQQLISTAKDSVFALESEKLSIELQEKYLAAQRENQIKELQKDKKVQRQFIILGGVLLLALTSLVLFYWRANRYRQRTNELLKNQQKEILQKSNHNELLVKEIHHRVKNNLQILSSLLSLQTDAEENDEIVDALKEGRNRVEAMGMIHQRLYGNDNITSINLKDYIPDLCNYLKGMISEPGIDIQSNIEIEYVDVETAIPLGLIINELITNSIKYAFKDFKNGLIEVALDLDDKENPVLTVSDNGIADSSFHSNKMSSRFGSDLIAILSRKLKGDISVLREEGYCTEITFKRFSIVK